MASERLQPAMRATREMAMSLLTAFRTGHEQIEPAAPQAGAGAPVPPPPAFSPTLMRAAEQRSRQLRRDQDLRVRKAELRRAILRYEHRIEELKLELQRLEAESGR